MPSVVAAEVTRLSAECRAARGKPDSSSVVIVGDFNHDGIEDYALYEGGMGCGGAQELFTPTANTGLKASLFAGEGGGAARLVWSESNVWAAQLKKNGTLKTLTMTLGGSRCGGTGNSSGPTMEYCQREISYQDGNWIEVLPPEERAKQAERDEHDRQFGETLWKVASCQAALGSTLQGVTPTQVTHSATGLRGEGYIYKFDKPVVSHGWKILGFYTSPWHFLPHNEVHALVEAPESEIMALGANAPDLPRKKGNLKFQPGQYWRFDGGAAEMIGVPAMTPERSTETGFVQHAIMQIVGITFYGNGITEIACLNPA